MTASTEQATVADLTAFQRDLLRLLANADDRKGTALKEDLASYYGEEINHSRLYQNLDTLAEHDLVTKRRRDRRTNEYGLTDAARDALARRDEWIAGDESDD